jgi:uncharacterized protein YukE
VRSVDHDPAAAATAAAACRTAADDLRATAQLLTGAIGDHLAAWEGASRIAFDGATTDIAADLLAEAADLDASADAIDAATGRARAAETSRRQAHERAERERAEREREARERQQQAGVR